MITTQQNSHKRNIVKFILISLLCLSACPKEVMKCTDLDTCEPIHLTSIGITTKLEIDPDDPGSGGGMDTAVYFKTQLVNKVNSCNSAIEKVIDSWVKEYSLTVVSQTKKEDELLILLTNPKLNGIFQFTYRIYPEKARASLNFYKPNGEKVEPALSNEILEKFKIANFQDNLTKGIKCLIQ